MFKTTNSILLDPGSLVGGSEISNYSNSPSTSTLVFTNDRANSNFGTAIAASGNYVVVTEHSYAFTYANQRSRVFQVSGSSNGYTLDLVATLSPFNLTSNDDLFFWGYSAAIDENSNRVAIGSPYDGPGYKGSVYVYDLQGTALFRLRHPNVQNVTDEQFGWSIAIKYGRIFVSCSGQNYKDVFIYDLNGNLIKAIYGSNRYQRIRDIAVGNGRLVVGNVQNFPKFLDIYDLDGNLLKTIQQGQGYVGNGYAEYIAIGNGRIVTATKDSYENNVYIYNLDGDLIRNYVNAFSNINYYERISIAIGDGKIIVGGRASYSPTTNLVVFDLNGNILERYDVADGYGASLAISNGRLFIGKPVNPNNGQLYIADIPKFKDSLELI